MHFTEKSKQAQKVTVLIGSGRKKRGATYRAAQRFLEKLQALGDVQGEIVFLSEQQLGLCRGCKVCFEHGEDRCPLKGDRDALVAKMLASDGVVLATPNYSFQVSAVTKAFLDRLGYVFHRPCFHGRAFTSIVVQGIYGAERIEKYLRFVGNGLGFEAVKGSCITALEPMTEKARRKMEASLTRQSQRFYAQLCRPAHTAPSLFKLMVFRMARTSMRQLLDDSNRDYAYYQAQGWFESDYYHATRLGLLKKALGALFDALFARIYRPSKPAALAASSNQTPQLVKEGSKS